jgi:hypothetical protein
MCGPSHLQMVALSKWKQGRGNRNRNVFSLIILLGIFLGNIVKLNKEKTFKMYYIQTFLNYKVA